MSPPSVIPAAAFHRGDLGHNSTADRLRCKGLTVVELRRAAGEGNRASGWANSGIVSRANRMRLRVAWARDEDGPLQKRGRYVA